MPDKYTKEIEKASKAADEGARKKTCFSDDQVIIWINARGVLTIGVFEDKRLFGWLRSFCERQYGVTRSTPPGEWYGTIVC